MNFTVKPSLEHIALVKIAASLWNQPNIRALVTEFWNLPLPPLNNTMFSPFTMITERERKWPRIQDKVIEKMAHLMIPTCLKEKLICYIQPIGMQILKWMRYHLKFCCFNLALPANFCWTSQGTIDKKRTAEVLIRDENIDVVTRYKLACLYCLEDNIPVLWNTMSESEKEFRHSMYDVMPRNDIKKFCVMKFVSFWTNSITSEDRQLDELSTCRNLFSFAVERGNKSATEYFLQKFDLNEDFILNTVVNFAKKHDYGYRTLEYDREYYNEVLLFLASQMNEEQQLKLFQQYPQQIMYCLLEWPFQSFFAETVKFLWNFIPKSEYFSILFKIIEKDFFGYKDYNYRKAFRDVWQQIHDADNSFFLINENQIPNLLDILLRMKDMEIIELIFKNATPAVKNKFILSDKGYYYCRNMINREEWDLVKFFVQLFITSKDEMIKFKKEFEGRIQARIALHQRNKNAEAKGYWTKFSQILDEFIRRYDKRDVDEGKTSSSKRLCEDKFQV